MYGESAGLTEEQAKEIWRLRSCKRRVRCFLEHRYQPQFDTYGVHFVNDAADGCSFELNEKGLRTWQAHLLLPDGYTLISAYYSLNSHEWQLVLEQDTWVIPKRDLDIPLVFPLLEQQADGKVRIACLKTLSERHVRCRYY